MAVATTDTDRVAVQVMESNAFNLLGRGANIRVRKLLGQTYLRENQLEDACQVYAGILADFPSDADALTILGNLYRISGCPGTAEHLYSRALEMNPDDRMLKIWISEAHEEQGIAEEEARPLLPQALSRLAGRLRVLGSTRGNEIRGAADMLDRLLPEAPSAASLAENNFSGAQPKDDLLMPALIEINIRQARTEGRSELAEALKSLQIHLTRPGDGAGGAPTG